MDSLFIIQQSYGVRTQVQAQFKHKKTPQAPPVSAVTIKDFFYHTVFITTTLQVLFDLQTVQWGCDFLMQNQLDL